MNPIFAAALEVQEFCAARRLRFCFIGGLALQRWGEPRLTQDVDLTVISGFGREPEYVDEFLSVFTPRIPDARDFALRHRVLLLLSRNEIPLDVALGAMPFEERAVSRSSPFLIGEGASLLTCSAEDLIIFKAFAGRPQDWIDIEGIVVRQRQRLDHGLVWQELLPLLELKEDQETAPRLRRLLAYPPET
ncbi:MAG: nucleotidyl transferase AbiEii/AbiGii toxin family protein [Candidatus Methylomirabilales bacterium]